ncbi:MAG: YaiI/YqxD family protein [Chitinispirillaceae bacterium]|nr:YaiI/YqxD family protein [Chitinispirillaceae bacterium]
MALHLYIDADACPVKQEVYRVAQRYILSVTLVANAPMRVPYYPWLKLTVVGDGLDEADNWIAERVQQSDIVITADIPLTDRCVKAGARVLSPTGKEFTEDNIGGALAMRNLMTDLRSAGTITGGPPPFNKRDRSRFLQQLDRIICAIQQEEKHS